MRPTTVSKYSCTPGIFTLSIPKFAQVMDVLVEDDEVKMLVALVTIESNVTRRFAMVETDTEFFYPADQLVYVGSDTLDATEYHVFELIDTGVNSAPVPPGLVPPS